MDRSLTFFTFKKLSPSFHGCRRRFNEFKSALNFKKLKTKCYNYFVVIFQKCFLRNIRPLQIKEPNRTQCLIFKRPAFLLELELG